MPRTTLKKCLAAAAAATVLVVPPAFAKPADSVRTSSLAGTVSPSQDLRGERAKDPTATVSSPAEVRAMRDVQRSEESFAGDPWPTPGARSVHPYAPVAASAPADADGAATWLIVTLSLAGLGAAGGAAGIALRRAATA
jgi:hypothetical protein